MILSSSHSRSTQNTMAEAKQSESKVVMEKLGELKGKTVMCTGCSRGLGLGFVEHLVKAGAQIIATCRSPDRATALTELVATAPAGSLALALDIGSQESIDACVAELGKKGVKHIDVLINNGKPSKRVCVFVHAWVRVRACMWRTSC